MKVNEYTLSRDTAAVISCIEEINEVKKHVEEALLLHYEESGVWGEEGMGTPVFHALTQAKEELHKIVSYLIEENLCDTDKGNNEI